MTMTWDKVSIGNGLWFLIRQFGYVVDFLVYNTRLVLYKSVVYLLLNSEQFFQASAEQRERMAMSMERINESSARLTESRRTILETEELGVSILQDLQQQRETLLHSHKKVCSLQAFYLLHKILCMLFGI